MLRTTVIRLDALSPRGNACMSRLCPKKGTTGKGDDEVTTVTIGARYWSLTAGSADVSTTSPSQTETVRIGQVGQVSSRQALRAEARGYFYYMLLEGSYSRRTVMGTVNAPARG